MIHFHAARNFLWTMERFIKRWAPQLKGVVHPVAYGDIDLASPVPPGLHLFTDFERLLPAERVLAARLHHRLANQPDSYATLNDPAAWTGRLGLLRDLSAAGINDFRAFPFHSVEPDLRFPAFLRWAHEHRGSLGAPVNSMNELHQRVDQRVTGRRQRRSSDLLVVEQMDVRSEDGLFRKYSAIKIGDQLVPRHLLFSEKWVTKIQHPTITPALAEEELEFLHTFPHEALVRQVFSMAGLDYGRIDYGFRGGRLQVWEINTNPVIVPHPGKMAPQRVPGQTWSAAAITAAFEELAAKAPTMPGRRPFGLAERAVWRMQSAVTRRYDQKRR
ncbi:MAG: hypothetical protein WB508_02355 [Aeromicrobium sp.]|uniref:hypothetical protein n=1 Tax=Aeromicrobium sp. TaxID=1871063 RepID=UPI003C539B64